MYCCAEDCSDSGGCGSLLELVVLFCSPRGFVRDMLDQIFIWLLDLLRDSVVIHYLSFHMQGFGIDLTSTPLPERLPQPVTLRQLDIFGDVPNGLLGIYDVVHLRLLVLVVQKGDPLPTIHRAHQMLKPGG